VFLVAHFHNVIIGGVVFGYLAGFTYWFPKIFGFKLDEKLGKRAFWCWLVGFYIAFMPLYALGLMGMTRRLNHYDASTGYHPWLVVAMIGSFIIAAGIFFQISQLVVSIKNREKLKVTTGDPWNGRTLEWSIPCPAPFYNFAHIPHVHSRDAFWEMKQQHLKNPNAIEKPNYKDVHMPRNTGTGFIIAIFSGIFGFAIIWHITWLLILGLIGIVATVIARTFNHDIDYYVKASEVEKIENQSSI
jgi:cytochrome o ubiquinol oxidase subunit 1